MNEETSTDSKWIPHDRWQEKNSWLQSQTLSHRSVRENNIGQIGKAVKRSKSRLRWNNWSAQWHCLKGLSSVTKNTSVTHKCKNQHSNFAYLWKIETQLGKMFIKILFYHQWFKGNPICDDVKLLGTFFMSDYHWNYRSRWFKSTYAIHVLCN